MTDKQRLALIDAEGVVLDRVRVDQMPDLPLLIGPGANGHARELNRLMSEVPTLKPQLASATWIGRRRWDLAFQTGETVALRVEDIDLRAGTLHVRRGKGGKGRLVPFGPQTARALDRYLRLRRQHRLADTPALWLGDQGRGFGYDALHFTLGRRAEAAGIPPACAPAHRRAPLAGGRRERGRPHGRGRLGTSRYARPVRRSDRERARRRRGQEPQPRGSLART